MTRKKKKERKIKKERKKERERGGYGLYDNAMAVDSVE